MNLSVHYARPVVAYLVETELVLLQSLVLLNIHQFLFGIASLLTFVIMIVCMLLGAS